MLPLLFSRKEFGIWGVGVVTIQCVLAFRYRQQSQEMGKAVPRMRWRACWACEHKLWVSVHSPVGRVCRNGMRKRASRLWRRYLCHCPITSLPLWVIQTDKWLAPRWVHLLLCLFSVHLILCAFHFAAYSLLIDRGSREIFGIPGKNKLILLGALLRRMEITGFSQLACFPRSERTKNCPVYWVIWRRWLCRKVPTGSQRTNLTVLPPFPFLFNSQ